MATAAVLGVVGGLVGIASSAVAYGAKKESINMKIDETIQDYEDQVTDYKAKLADYQKASAFNMAAAGKENAYRAIVARQEGALGVGSARAGLGFSGVAGQSPLMALAQTERMASDTTNETIRSGNMALQGMGQQYTTLTGAYRRSIDYAKGKQQYLRDNRTKMVRLGSAGELVELGGSFLNFGMNIAGL